MGSREFHVETLFQSAQVGFQRLALARHGSRFCLADVHEACLGIAATAVALSLGACYVLLHSRNLFVSRLSQLLLTVFCALIIGRPAYAVYLLIYIRYAAFGHLKVSVGLLGIEYGWHKVSPVVATGKQSGVSSNKSQCPLRSIGFFTLRSSFFTYHEYSEHFATTRLALPYARLDDVVLDFGGGKAA